MTLKVSAFVLLCAVVVSGRRAMDLKQDSVTANDVTYSFKPLKKITKYYVKITRSDAPDEIVYDRNLRESSKAAGTERYEVPVHGLTPDTQYVIEVYTKKRNTELASATFTTSCDEYTLQCKGFGVDGQIIQKCLEQHELCDKFAACKDSKDEKVNADGTCFHTLPPRPRQSFWSGLVDAFGDWAGIQ